MDQNKKTKRSKGQLWTTVFPLRQVLPVRSWIPWVWNGSGLQHPGLLWQMSVFAERQSMPLRAKAIDHEPPARDNMESQARTVLWRLATTVQMIAKQTNKKSSQSTNKKETKKQTNKHTNKQAKQKRTTRKHTKTTNQPNKPSKRKQKKTNKQTNKQTNDS